MTSKYNVLNNIPRLLIETICMGGILGYLGVYILMDQDLTAMVTQIAAFGYAATRLIPSVNRLNGHMTNIAFLLWESIF